MTCRARWTLMGDRAYEALSEAHIKDGWCPMFKVVLHRVHRWRPA